MSRQEEDQLSAAIDLAGQLKREIGALHVRAEAHQTNLEKTEELLRQTQALLAAARQPTLFGGGRMMDDENTAFEMLKEMLGPEQALRVAENFAGTSLYIPKSVIISARHQAIQDEYRAGATYRELSAKYGYSNTHIRAVIHRKKERINNGKV
jgi:hypothetical protein